MPFTCTVNLNYGLKYVTREKKSVLYIQQHDKEILFRDPRDHCNHIQKFQFQSDKEENCFARIDYVNNKCVKLLFYVSNKIMIHQDISNVLSEVIKKIFDE